jgi:hypothetical protein
MIEISRSLIQVHDGSAKYNPIINFIIKEVVQQAALPKRTEN